MVSAFILLAGCSMFRAEEASRIDDIKIDDKNPNCVRQCLQTHATCSRNSGNTFAIDVQANMLGACKSNYKVCVQTCPDK